MGSHNAPVDSITKIAQNRPIHSGVPMHANLKTLSKNQNSRLVGCASSLDRRYIVLKPIDPKQLITSGRQND
jgi:hypothetical protein